MNEFCCANCFDKEQDTIQNYIQSHGFDNSDECCPYCGESKHRKIDLRTIGAFIADGVERAYEVINEGLYDSEEKRYMMPDGSIFSIYEILKDEQLVFLDDLENRDVYGKCADHVLAQELMEACSGRTPRNPDGRDFSDIDSVMYIQKLTDYETDIAEYANWDEFVYACKHYNRFFDLCELTSKGNAGVKREPERRNFRNREELLDGLHKNCLRHLVVELPAGTHCYRARIANDEKKDVGPAPRCRAKNDRMSPQGISYFYVAEEIETALAEIHAKNEAHVLTGTFKTKKELRVIDWTLPTIAKRLYDIFDEDYNQHAAVYRDFIAHFVEEVTTKRDEGNTKLIYIPTQLIAEYIRMLGYDGIRYGSSISSGCNIVLFYGPVRTEDDKNWEIIPEYTEIVELEELQEMVVDDDGGEIISEKKIRLFIKDGKERDEMPQYSPV